MNVHYVKGDIMLTRADAIGHGTNAQGIMGAGLAKTLARRYPLLAQDYRDACRRGVVGPGLVHPWKGPPLILNLCTQEGFRGARLRYVENAFANLRTMVEVGTLPIHTLAIPRIGCGLGALSWEAVLPIILRSVRRLPLQLYIYTDYQAGTMGDEPLGRHW